MLSFPSFSVAAEKDVAAFNAVLDEIAAHRTELQSATVVIDVRRNGGGSSLWGDKIAAALWGKAWVSRIHKLTPTSTEFRASSDNLARIDEYIAASTAREGAASDAVAYLRVARDAIAAALKNHQPLARLEGKSAPPGAAPPNPMQGKVYFLTDNACGSACLDFADIVRRMPGVIHIGLPTYADSVYMEANGRLLPSGLATLQYPMKVYRNRLRKNNEFYVPQIVWTGGPMTDDGAMIAWVKSLP